MVSIVKSPKSLAPWSKEDGMRMTIRAMQNASVNQRRKNGHAQPSLPKINFQSLPLDDDNDAR